jgi:2-polyprenyl-3-methyl-5-hydroxy-6-metoxy-1,4-benzoquinol methylase
LALKAAMYTSSTEFPQSVRSSLSAVKTLAIVACPACGSDLYDDFLFGGNHTLRRCRGCEMVFATEYGDPAEIYVDGYLKGETDFGLDLSHPMFQEFLAYAAHQRLALVERVTRPPGRFLDVGCGSGEVLVVARERGWTVQGAEPVAESARIAHDERGLDVKAAILEESGLPERSYDVVSAFHVLEHMRDGQGFLRTIARWARPGGHVVIEVPNWASVHRRAWGRSWPGLRPLEHLAHYTPASLAATMRRSGLDPVQVHTPGFLWKEQTFDQMLADLGLQRASARLHRARVLTRPGTQLDEPATKPTALGWMLLLSLQRAYAVTRAGQVILAIARVP